MAHMNKKLRTTVVLTHAAEQVLAKYRNAYGVKNVLSVGLELFDSLSRDEQFKKITASEAAELVASAEARQATHQRSLDGKPRSGRGGGRLGDKSA